MFDARGSGKKLQPTHDTKTNRHILPSYLTERVEVSNAASFATVVEWRLGRLEMRVGGCGAARRKILVKLIEKRQVFAGGSDH